MKDLFYDSIKKRRSRYQLKDEITISEEKLKDIIKYGIKHTPTAFNSQTSRAYLLLENEQNEFWDLVLSELKEIVPEDKFGDTKEKINSFKAAYGTILFFEDLNIVDSLQERFPLYSDNFPIWSNQASGMLQYVIWTSLAKEGIGASLQHYNEIIEDEIKEKYDIDSNYKLVAQMPFGTPIGEPKDKEFDDLDKRFKVLK
ncbi:MAG: nitroreductase family protein [Bacillota bacterium]